jgi:hypothetical protein
MLNLPNRLVAMLAAESEAAKVHECSHGLPNRFFDWGGPAL